MGKRYIFDFVAQHAYYLSCYSLILFSILYSGGLHLIFWTFLFLFLLLSGIASSHDWDSVIDRVYWVCVPLSMTSSTFSPIDTPQCVLCAQLLDLAFLYTLRICVDWGFIP
jgi:hypothetical protein